MQSGRYKEAESSYRHTAKAHPELASVHHRLGEALERQSLLDQAIESYKTTLNIEPGFWQAHDSIAGALERQGLINEAFDHHLKTIAFNRDSWNSYLKIGNILSNQGQLKDAISYYCAGMADIPENDRFQFHLKLGDTHLKLENATDSISHYLKAISIKPESRLCYRGLGLAYAQLENWDKAKSNFVEALQIDPNYHAVFQDLGRLYEKQGLSKEAKQCFSLEIPDTLEKEFLKSTVESLRKTLSTDNNAITHRVAHDSKEISLTSPVTVDGKVKPHFTRRAAQTSDTFVAEVLNGRIWLGGKANVAFTAQKEVIEDISTTKNYALFCSDRLPPAKPIDGTVCSLVTNGGPIYGHFLFDVIPRIEILRKAGFNLNEIDLFVLNQYRKPFHIEAMELLGIPASKIVEKNAVTHIQPSKFIYPSPPRREALISEWVCDFLNDTFLKTADSNDSTYPKRIYLNRKNAKHRRVLNEDALTVFLANHGFESIEPELLSVSETATLFRNAEAIISPHGSGTLNTAFCNPGTKIIELFSEHIYIDCWLISNLRQCEYYSIYCAKENMPSAVKNAADAVDINKLDMAVDLDELENLMKIAKLL